MPQPATTRRHAQGRYRAVVLTIGLAGLLWMAGALALRAWHAGQVLPGTTVAGVDLGGADAAEARKRLGRLRAPKRVLALTDGSRRFAISSGDAALGVDLDGSAVRALRAGRGGVRGFLGSPWRALAGQREVEPVYAIDRAALARVVARVAREIDVRPFAGGLSVDAATLEVSVEAPASGRLVDRRALSRAVASALRRGTPRRIVVPVGARPGPSLLAVERVAAEASAYLSGGGLRLTGVGASVSVRTSELAPLLGVERSGRGVRLGVGAPALARLVARIAERRDRAAVDARLNAAAAPVVLEDKDDVSWRPRRVEVRVRPARAGFSVRRDTAAAAIAKAIRDRSHDVVVPVRRAAPAITTTGAKRVRSLIGTFTTRYPCCAARVKNIRLIARAVDNTVVAPGARFSLNEAAGRRTRARGFVPAPFIADGEIVPSVGGGVSQFSTTMFNAAYFAGLRLDTHQPHSFFIDRYPAGREATLDFGSIDLVWTNDTSVPILVRTSSTQTSVTVSLYGANGGRRVRAGSDPRQRVPGRDFSITVTRTIRYGDGRVVRQPFTTTYDEPPEDD